MSRTYKRGDLYFADLGQGVGSEQAGDRPVVIIQNDVGNLHSPTVIVAAVTSQTAAKVKLPTHYYMESGNGLERPSIILLEQIRTIDKKRMGRFIGRLDVEQIAGLDHALAVSVDLICPESSAMVMSLCGSCVRNFRNAGAWFLCRVDPGQMQKETCTYCGQRSGFDYFVMKK